MFEVVLGSLKEPTQQITLGEGLTKQHAEQLRKAWRMTLGNKNWTIDRRPGLDTLDHLTLSVKEKKA